ncbi:MAG: hypothetical protein ACYDG2_20610 [Ruminiclostridium sp.]
MFIESKTKIIFTSISLLLVGLLFTACVANDKIITQAAINEQEVTFSSSSDTSDEISNQTEASVQTDAIIDKKADKVIKTWEDYEASKLPLLSAIPEKGIYLYDTKADQVILKVGDNTHNYDWSCLTPRFILPGMQVSDFDADGKDELSVILHIGSGTGVAIEDLHIVEISEGKTLSGKQLNKMNPEYFKDYIFSSKDYISQLHKAIGFNTFAKAGQLMGKITINTKTYPVSLKDFKSEECGKISDDIVWGNIVYFISENTKLTAQFGVGIACENFASPQYIGTLFADVNYKAGKFKLKNFKFEGNIE